MRRHKREPLPRFLITQHSRCVCWFRGIVLFPSNDSLRFGSETHTAFPLLPPFQLRVLARELDWRGGRCEAVDREVEQSMEMLLVFINVNEEK